jgi:hypothetical protein
MGRAIFATGDFSPEAQSVLRCVPSELWFHNEHKFRHPLGIYNLSLQQVGDDLKRVLDQHEQLRHTLSQGLAVGREDVFADLMAAQRSLIYSLREHIDDCHMVLMCFVNPKGINVGNPGAAEFLRVAKFHEVSILLQPLREYLDNYLLPIANKLKHRQARLSGCAFFTGQDIRIGFYVQEVDNKETAGPSVELHGGNSAYSFARDIHFNFFHVYLTSEALAKTVRAVVKKHHKHLGYFAAGLVADDRWRILAERIARLDRAVFPQEVKTPYPEIEMLNTYTMRLEYPSEASIAEFPANAGVHVSMRGDGMTRSFRMPYFGKKRP